MRWSATVPGRFYRPLSKPITLLAVTITPVGAAPEVGLALEVSAADGGLANRKAIEQIDAASGAARIVLNSPIDRDPVQIPVVHSVDPVGGGHIWTISMGAMTVIVGAPVDAAAEANIASSDAVVTAMDPDDRDLTNYLLRWYNMAVNARQTIEQFAFAWIALEAATNANGDDTIPNMLTFLEMIYSGSPSSLQLEKMICPVYDIRNNNVP